MGTLLVGIIFTFVIGLLIFSMYANYVSFKKIEILETKLIQLQDTVIQAHEIMMAIDQNGSFAADDEVGDAFKLLHHVVHELSTLIVEESDDIKKN